jgi:hypothetical protein
VQCTMQNLECLQVGRQDALAMHGLQLMSAASGIWMYIDSRGHILATADATIRTAKKGSVQPSSNLCFAGSKMALAVVASEALAAHTMENATHSKLLVLVDRRSVLERPPVDVLFSYVFTFRSKYVIRQSSPRCMRIVLVPAEYIQECS